MFKLSYTHPNIHTCSQLAKVGKFTRDIVYKSLSS